MASNTTGKSVFSPFFLVLFSFLHLKFILFHKLEVGFESFISFPWKSKVSKLKHKKPFNCCRLVVNRLVQLGLNELKLWIVRSLESQCAAKFKQWKINRIWLDILNHVIKYYLSSTLYVLVLLSLINNIGKFAKHLIISFCLTHKYNWNGCQSLANTECVESRGLTFPHSELNPRCLVLLSRTFHSCRINI